jgi:hypothetical protein
MAVEALGSSPDYFHPAVHRAKHHPGQLAVAETPNGSRRAAPLDEIRGRARQSERAASE